LRTASFEGSISQELSSTREGDDELDLHSGVDSSRLNVGPGSNGTSPELPAKDNLRLSSTKIEEELAESQPGGDSLESWMFSLSWPTLGEDMVATGSAQEKILRRKIVNQC
jgi:hypothetical protein